MFDKASPSLDPPRSDGAGFIGSEKVPRSELSKLEWGPAVEQGSSGGI